jgi:rhamnosyl/mannosyltransferase
MAAGLPVLNTSIPDSGVAWVCRHGESGLTVPIDDPQALAQAAQRMIDDTDLRKRLSAGGKARAKADFDQEVMATRVREIYEAVLKGKPSQ